MSSAIAYSFSKNDRQSLSNGRNGSPAPDQYDPDRGMKIVKELSPEWFARGERQGLGGSEAPGPGQYQSDTNKLRMNVSYSIASPSKNFSPERSQRDSMPGPGQYESIIKSQQPTFSMGQKRKEINYNNTPGPGAYEPPHKNEIQKSASKRIPASPFLSKSKRAHQSTLSQNFQSPGPGQYEPKQDYTKSKMPVFNMGKGQRGITSRDLSPGPGTYDGVKKEIGKDSKKVTIGGRPQTAKVNNTPGPGSYNYNNKTIDEITKSQRGVSAFKNKSMRMSPVSKDQVTKPGPGAYNGNDNIVRDRTPVYGFGKTNRSSLINKEDLNKPGPGNYDLKNMNSSKSFKIGSKPSSAIKNNIPGPGNYDPNLGYTQDKVRTAKISKPQNQQNLYHSKSTNQMPGPGQYYKGGEFGKDAVSFSIKGRPQDNNRNNSPGPGGYDPRDDLSKDRVPSAKIMSGSKRNADLYKTIDMPGPGQYSDPNQFGKDAKSFSIKSKPQDRMDSRSPGPGHYEPNNSLVKPNIMTFKQSSSQRVSMVQKEAQSKPGPGMYTDGHKTIGKDLPSFTMGKKHNYSISINNPGPGMYDPNASVVKDNVRNFKMSTSKRPDIAPKTAREAPGPGQYTSPKRFGEGARAVSIRGRVQDLKKDQNPGPGAYDATNQLAKAKSPSFRMGTTKRAGIVGSEQTTSPGPGNYDQKSNIGQGPQFAFALRNEPKQRNDTPGPGNYEPFSSLVKDSIKAFKMGSSTRQNIVSSYQQDLPGPGNYESPSKNGGPQYTFKGRSKSRQELSPGPGQYEPKDSLIKDKIPAYGLGNTQRQDIINKSLSQLPGPGQYSNAQDFGKNNKSFTIQGRPQDRQGNDIPGPGNYASDFNAVKDRVVSHKISQSQRMDMVSNETRAKPGPGAYDSPQRFGQDAQSVTIRGRPEDNIRSLSPGPGNYDHSVQAIKDKVISYKMGASKRQDIVNKSASELPGPGSYINGQDFGKNNKSFTIQGRPQDIQENQNPGPGNYIQDANVIKDRVISHKISLSQRQDIISNDMRSKPGPGTYDSPSRFGQYASSVTIRGRPEDNNRNDSPGPGNYDPSQSATKDKIVAYKMSGSQRQDIVSKDQRQLPGPGIYDQHSVIGQGQSFTIGGKQKELLNNKAPGPGAYDPKDFLTKDNTVTYKMPSSNRVDIVSREAQSLPGPGQYTNGKNFGQDASTFSIRGRPEDRVGNYLPGPGTYEPALSQSKERIVSYKLGKASRTDIVSREATLSPGPGMYDSPSKKSGPNYSIGVRVDSPPRNDIPGPGQYNANESAVKYQSPSVRISGGLSRSTLVSGDKLNNPGPGSYDQHTSMGQGQAFKIGGRGSPERANAIPGPGTYNADSSTIKDRPRTAHITQTKRDFLTINSNEIQNPGPGFYDVKNLNNGPAVSIKGRQSERPRNDIPGPGTYDLDESALRHHNPSFGFGRSPDRSRSGSPWKEGSVGPGQYDNRNYDLAAGTSIVYSIPKGENKEPNNDNPGPGHYKIPVNFANTTAYSGINHNQEFRWV